MSRSLHWTRRALQQVEKIGDHIASDSPSTAEKVMSRLLAVAENLRSYPAMGRVGRISGTRELVLADLSYIIAYRVAGTRVETVAVIHTSRRWPENI